VQLKIKINLATELASQTREQTRPFDMIKIRNFFVMLVVMSSTAGTMAYSMHTDEPPQALNSVHNDDNVGILPIIMDDDAPAKLPSDNITASMMLKDSQIPSPYLDSSAEQEAFEEEMDDLESPNSHFVNRAQLTLAISGREPTDNVTSISLSSDKKLFLFTQINQKKDQVIYHRWMFNDKQMAQIKLHIGSDQWRTYSSKTFNRQMLGQWQVNVVDENEQILKSIKFDVTH